MTALETFALFCAIITGCLALTALSWRAEQYIRRAYAGARVAYDDAELAEMVDADEQAWREWADICGLLGIDPRGGTPIYDALVCEEIERREWSA